MLRCCGRTVRHARTISSDTGQSWEELVNERVQLHFCHHHRHPCPVHINMSASGAELATLYEVARTLSAYLLLFGTLLCYGRLIAVFTGRRIQFFSFRRLFLRLISAAQIFDPEATIRPGSRLPANENDLTLIVRHLLFFEPSIGTSEGTSCFCMTNGPSADSGDLQASG